MKTFEDLKQHLEKIIYPGFNKHLKNVEGIKKLTITSAGIVECDTY